MEQAIVQRLRAGFATGKTRPIEWRLKELNAIRRCINENKDELLYAVQKDLGHGQAASPFLTEIMGPLEEIEKVEAHLSEWMKPSKVALPGQQFPGKGYIIREPLGVVLIISPWNYPLNLCLMPMIGAIAGGNCILLKPSEVASETAAAIQRLFPKYLDFETFACVTGGVEETTALLKFEYDHIFYTGNGAVGRVILEAAAKYLTPVTLELGGKSPVYVDKNVDLEVAANRITWGKYMNNGQTCIAPDYVMVHKSVYDEFAKLVVDRIAKFYGKDPKTSPDYSRVINSRHTSRLEKIINAQGNGTLLHGGKVDIDNRYIEPTVFKDVPLTSELMKDELFGPIMPLMPISGVDEFISIVNSRPKPLALYIFTKDNAVVDKVIGNTSAGGVCVNETIMHVAVSTLPFGGVGASGMGAYHGKHSFDTFTHAKAVLHRETWLDPKNRYPPYPRDLPQQLEKLRAMLQTLPTVGKAAAALLITGVILRSKL